MKLIARNIVALLAAMLVVGAIAGCSSQASSTSASESSASASTASSTAKSEELTNAIADLKATMTASPTYKSVTVAEVNTSVEKGSNGSSGAKSGSEPETIEATGVYKFDMSGDELKTSSVNEMLGDVIEYYTDGSQAVFVMDGEAYSGTIGELGQALEYSTDMTKDETGDGAAYVLKLDPDKYAESDETLGAMADAGVSFTDVTLSVRFDADGHVAKLIRTANSEDGTYETTVEFSDFDNTIVDPAPEATKTYADLEAKAEQELNSQEG